jgi:hypothetical protein
MRQRKSPAANSWAFKLVAWGRIELPTRGFSKHVFVKDPAFMGLAEGFRAS